MMTNRKPAKKKGPAMHKEDAARTERLPLIRITPQELEALTQRARMEGRTIGGQIRWELFPPAQRL